jgi:hypothetical protein
MSIQHDMDVVRAGLLKHGGFPSGEQSLYHGLQEKLLRVPLQGESEGHSGRDAGQISL